MRWVNVHAEAGPFHSSKALRSSADGDSRAGENCDLLIRWNSTGALAGSIARPTKRVQLRFKLQVHQHGREEVRRPGVQDLTVKLDRRDLAIGVELPVRFRHIRTRLDPNFLDFVAEFIGGPAHLAAAVDVGEKLLEKLRTKSDQSLLKPTAT